SAGNCQRKIPRGDYGCNTSRMVTVNCGFAQNLLSKEWLPKDFSLIRIVVAKIDRLTNIIISFTPRFTAFANHHSGKKIASFAKQLSGFSQNVRALLKGQSGPTRKLFL